MVRIAKKTEYSSNVDELIENTKELSIAKPQEKEAEVITEFKGIDIHVKNIDPEVTIESLKELFSFYGTLINLEIKFVNESKSRRYAVVSYSSPASASHAIRYLNGSTLLNSQIYVTLAPKPRERKRSSNLNIRKMSLTKTWSAPEQRQRKISFNYSNDISSRSNDGDMKASDFLFLIKDSNKRTHSL